MISAEHLADTGHSIAPSGTQPYVGRYKQGDVLGTSGQAAVCSSPSSLPPPCCIALGPLSLPHPHALSENSTGQLPAASTPRTQCRLGFSPSPSPWKYFPGRFHKLRELTCVANATRSSGCSKQLGISIKRFSTERLSNLEKKSEEDGAEGRSRRGINRDVPWVPSLPLNVISVQDDFSINNIVSPSSREFIIAPLPSEPPHTNYLSIGRAAGGCHCRAQLPQGRVCQTWPSG